MTKDEEPKILKIRIGPKPSIPERSGRSLGKVDCRKKERGTEKEVRGRTGCGKRFPTRLNGAGEVEMR